MENPLSAEDIFFGALQKGTPEEREEYLDDACHENPELRGRVERLLQAHQQAAGILDRPVIDVQATIERPSAEGDGDRPTYCAADLTGTTIGGRYKLLEEIGEGGMGTVWVAEQTQPVRRHVALKLIKPGMDSRQVLSRFEAERQALALMDHPHIAKVFDGGVTDLGRPFFVMELVKGLPITEYCDQVRLGVEDRLHLFVQVCQAVQHAHQKGIIHRDLKPTNVLVAKYDNQVVPKVIDFGIAKAIAHRLTDRTIFTEFGQVVGTLEYMSPEQAKLNQLDVDTRSDIYSLGVLLYELLTGTTPFERKRLQEAAFDEMLRIIREEEPPKPSTKLSSSDRLPSIAANRSTEPTRLSKKVRRDLDWIVMKCLDKDRNRRYETAAGLAREIQRYLQDEPVEACPPSVLYQLRKFVRRKKRSLLVGVILGVLLLAAVGSLGWTVIDRIMRRSALEEQIAQSLDESEALYSQRDLIQSTSAAKQAEALSGVGLVSAPLERRLRHWLLDLETVERLDQIRLERTIHDDPNWANQAYEAVFKRYGLGDVDALDAAQIHEWARKMRSSRIKEDLVSAMYDWCLASTRDRGPLLEIIQLADPDPWRKRLNSLLMRKEWIDPQDLATEDALAQPPSNILLLTDFMLDTYSHATAIDLLRIAQQRHPNDFWINYHLGRGLVGVGTSHRKPEEAVGFLRAAVALRPTSPVVHAQLANALRWQQKPHEAEIEYQRAVQLQPKAAVYREQLANFYRSQKRWQEAIVEFEKSVSLDPGRQTSAYLELAAILSRCPDVRFRNPQRAVELAGKAVEMNPDSKFAWESLGAAHYDAGQWQASIKALEKAISLVKTDPIAWQMLGQARYRAGQWQASIEAIEKSIELPDAVPFDTPCYYPTRCFYLAMAHWELGHKDEAHQWHMRGTQRIESYLWEIPDEVRTLQSESGALLQAVPTPITQEPTEPVRRPSDS